MHRNQERQRQTEMKESALLIESAHLACRKINGGTGDALPPIRPRSRSIAVVSLVVASLRTELIAEQNERLGRSRCVIVGVIAIGWREQKLSRGSRCHRLGLEKSEAAVAVSPRYRISALPLPVFGFPDGKRRSDKSVIASFFAPKSRNAEIDSRARGRLGACARRDAEVHRAGCEADPRERQTARGSSPLPAPRALEHESSALDVSLIFNLTELPSKCRKSEYHWCDLFLIKGD